MLQHCPEACEIQAELDRAMADDIEKKIGHINSFFELEARNIDKELVKFDQFRGKVTVITNVASYCGEFVSYFTQRSFYANDKYTLDLNTRQWDIRESHYNGLVKLYEQFKSEDFNILAFPCNQFGKQEPEECPAIKRFAKEEGLTSP
ncbi:hypothetical protein ACHAW5_000967 [Stephanodiscus triporus]|uniref:Glutathione peroxidase n=1 Tax=Stephanodiscus triporus TaxID=2934178 RepID=A0ABD3QR65_9STRA